MSEPHTNVTANRARFSDVPREKGVPTEIPKSPSKQPTDGRVFGLFAEKHHWFESRETPFR
jgi:hypothetical protein